MSDEFYSFVSVMAEWWDGHGADFLSALAGAFFGALAAYWFQQSSDKLKQRDAEHGALIRAQLALLGRLNTLQNIQQQFLEKHRADPRRATNMPMFHQAETSLPIDFDSLTFLLLTDHADLVNVLHLADRCYATSITTLAMRNEAMERMHSQGQPVDFDMKTGQGKIVADARHIKLVMDLTEALYESVDDSVKKCDAVIKEIKKVGKVIFPKKKFLSLETVKPKDATS